MNETPSNEPGLEIGLKYAVIEDFFLQSVLIDGHPGSCNYKKDSLITLKHISPNGHVLFIDEQGDEHYAPNSLNIIERSIG